MSQKDADRIATRIASQSPANGLAVELLVLAREYLALRASPPEAEGRAGGRADTLNEVADRLHEEYLTDNTGTPSDIAYNAAVAHCIGAVNAMMFSPGRSPSE